MARDTHPFDPRGLIREAYKIDGITPEQARVIFLDWALGRADTPDETAQIAALLESYGPGAPDHPMTEILRDGLEGPPAPSGRRGGRKARLGSKDH